MALYFWERRRLPVTGKDGTGAEAPTRKTKHGKYFFINGLREYLVGSPDCGASSEQTRPSCTGT